MTGDARNLARRVQEETVRGARSFLGASLGRLRERLAGDRSQLEDLERQLVHEDTRARIREFIDSCLAVEASIAEAVRNLGLEDEAAGTPGQSEDAGERDDQPSSGQTEQAVSGALNTASGVVESAAGTTSQLAGQVGQVAEKLPGGKLLGRTTDESGRTVQRVAYESGDIIRTTLDESWELVDENLVGNLAALPAEEESSTDEGHTLRTVRDDSGALVNLELGPDGNVLGLEVLPDDR